MDSRSWQQQSGTSSSGGGQSSRTTYTSSSSSYNNNDGHQSTSSSSHNNGSHRFSSFEGFPSFDSLSQPSFTSLTRQESHSGSGIDSQLKSLQDRGTAVVQKDQDRSAEWDRKMKEVQDRQEAFAKEEKERAESYERRLKDLQAREDELAKREEQERSSKVVADDQKGAAEEAASGEQAKKEAEIQRKLDDLKLIEQKVAADCAALDKSRTDLAAERKEFQQRVKEFEDAKSSAENDALQAKKNLEQREKEMVAERKEFEQRVKEFEDTKSSAENLTSQAKKSLEQRPKDLGNQTSTTPRKHTPATKQHECHCADAVSDADLQKKQRENAQLEQRLARLEKQLSHLSAASLISERASKARSTIFSTGEGSMGCGYKHYKPPRKLNRKLIGMVYE